VFTQKCQKKNIFSTYLHTSYNSNHRLSNNLTNDLSLLITMYRHVVISIGLGKITEVVNIQNAVLVWAAIDHNKIVWWMMIEKQMIKSENLLVPSKVQNIF